MFFVICDDSAQEMENGVGYKNTGSGAPVVNIASASQDKNFEKLFIEITVLAENERWIVRFIGVYFLQ